MIKRIKAYFFPDWQLVIHKTAEWDITHKYTCGTLVLSETRYCSYRIEFSPVRNYYRLVTSGYQPEQHPLYEKLVNIVAKRNLKLNGWIGNS